MSTPFVPSGTPSWGFISQADKPQLPSRGLRTALLNILFFPSQQIITAPRDKVGVFTLPVKFPAGRLCWPSAGDSAGTFHKYLLIAQRVQAIPSLALWVASEPSSAWLLGPRARSATYRFPLPRVLFHRSASRTSLPLEMGRKVCSRTFRGWLWLRRGPHCPVLSLMPLGGGGSLPHRCLHTWPVVRGVHSSHLYGPQLGA